jgi:UDPglucose 6-dehydrogenase
MRLAMIGAGYVGLTTGVCLAALGHHVQIYDSNPDRLGQLLAAKLPIYEPGLEDELRQQIEAGRVAFSPLMRRSVAGARAVFLAVGTPAAADGSVDLAQIEKAAREVAPHLESGATIVIKSTVGAGTSRRVREIVAEARGALDISVASNPEFLREGSALQDFMEPDRIVLGYDDPRAGEVLAEIYAPLAEAAPIVHTSTTNAELSKHAANAFLALKIGFVNEVADLCERVGGDISAVARSIGLDRRIGSDFLKAGPGFGGSCFPKDTRAFAAAGRRHGAPLDLVESVIRRNDHRQAALARRIVTAAGLKEGDDVAILGAAFKADTDDVRESPALRIAGYLIGMGVRLKMHDPKAAQNGQRLLPQADWVDSPYRAAIGAKALVILTEWPQYRQLDLQRLAAAMDGCHLFDYRNLLERRGVEAAGLVHHRIGTAPRSLQAPVTVELAGRARAG